MKPCTGCKWLHREYYRGPVCRLAHTPLPDNPYTGQRQIRIGFLGDARAPDGICGPDASLYEESKIAKWFGWFGWSLAAAIICLLFWEVFIV
jgi:hypothetical protein